MTRNLVALLALAVSLGCSRAEKLTMSEIQSVGGDLGKSASPAMAISPTGQRAFAWVEAGDAPRGELSVKIGNDSVSVIVDSLGLVQSHSEAPPQMVFADDSTVHIAYVVTKDVGARFPVSSLRFVSTHDAGRSWTSPATITDDTLAFGAHNFHSLSAGPDGTLYASWLDGRHGKTATYVATSRDAGKTWSSNSRVSTGESCPCCRTSVVASANGTVYVAWRAVLKGSIRDIVVVKSTDFGATWGEPVVVHNDNWEFNGCPHAGPSIRLDSLGVLHILWWTGKKDAGGVFYSKSLDSGASFVAPIAIQSQAIPIPTHVSLGVSGNIQGRQRVIAVLDDLSGNPTRIVMRSSSNGGKSFSDEVSISDLKSNASHPILALSGNRAHIIWIEKVQHMNILLREVTFLK